MNLKSSLFQNPFYRLIKALWQPSCMKLLFLLLCLINTTTLHATYIQVYTGIANGSISYAGNALGLNGGAGALNNTQPGTSGDIGAFITTNTTLQVGTYPVGTTLDWTLNSSMGMLDLPAGSTILHAELVWSASFGFNGLIPLSETYAPITMITPDSVSHTITYNPATAQEALFPIGATTTGIYTRSADVTALVQAAGAGAYIVGGVPGTVLGIGNVGYDCAGWTLEVAYENPNMFTSSLNLYVAAERQNNPALLVTEFQTPASGTFTASLFVSGLEGDPNATGDRLLIGPTSSLVYPANALSGTNNPINNFFASQINTLLPLTTDVVTGKLVASGSSSLLDTRGTFGNSNSNATTSTGVSGARQGYDITSINISNRLTSGQQQIYAQPTSASSGENYMVNSLAIQIQVESPVIQSTKTADVSTVILNDVVTFTSSFSNIGLSNASSLIFTDPLPLGMTYVPNSLTVDGILVPGADIVAGVPLGNLAVGATRVVEFQATVTQINPPTSYENIGYLDYTFIPSTGSSIALSAQTNVVTITTPVLPPPIVNPDTGTTEANIVFNGTSVLSNDVGTNLTISAYDITSTQGGSILMQPNGTYSYTPPLNFSGTDTFNYTAIDAVGQTGSTTVTITVLPIANVDSGEVAANTPLNQNTSVLDNDIGTGLFVVSYDSTSEFLGSIVMQPTGTYVYTPAPNFSGLDTFNYTVQDAIGNTSTTTVTINVLPAASDDVGTTPANTPLNGTTVFTNDVGTGLTMIAYDSISAQGGTVVMNMLDGTYTYTPPLNFSGIDTFTYTVEDQDGNIDVATVTITVLPVAVNDVGSTMTNVPLNQAISVLSNDIGVGLLVSNYDTPTLQGGAVVMLPNGTYIYTPPMNFSGIDNFFYTAQDTASSSATAQVVITIVPDIQNDTAITFANTTLLGPSVLTNDVGTTLQIYSYQHPSSQGGSVSMNTDGTYTYIPPLNFSGIDTFMYIAIDSSGNTSSATVTITVLPTTSDSTATTFANTTLVQTTSVLANDVGAGLMILNYQNPSAQGGSVVMNPDGTYVYTPPLNFSGIDTFTYTVIDAALLTTTGTVTITVLPVANDLYLTTPMDTKLKGPSVFNSSVGTDLSIASYQTTSQAGGKVVMKADGTFTYTPPSGFIGQDSFTYTLVDGSGNTVTGTVYIAVGLNEPPLNFTGVIKTYHFLNQSDYALRASWRPSLSPNITAYRIYFRRMLVAQIPATAPLIYETCLASKELARFYSISSVSASGVESQRVRIRIVN